MKLPFGLNTSSEIFQRKLHQALEGLDGTLCVADDIIIYGCTPEEHDIRLVSLLERCRQVGIKLNKQKSEICASKIKFLGHEVSDQGLHADPDKIEAIMEMPTPTE